MLNYIEERTYQTLDVLRQSYDDLHERAYKLVTVLVAGGGAAGVYVITKLGAPSVPILVWAPVAALALSWFGTAAVLIWRGATSKELSPGIGPKTLLENYDWRVRDGQVSDVAVQGMRRQELELAQNRIDDYSDGCSERAQAIDVAYKSAAICTPLVPTVVVLIYFFGR